jgi:hypothetical protein
MMSRHWSSLTVGFLKKLPALPMTAGSGSLARRMAQTQSKICAPWAVPPLLPAGGAAGPGSPARASRLGQGQAHGGDHGAARQPHAQAVAAGRMLEDRVAVAEAHCAASSVNTAPCAGPRRPANGSGPAAPAVGADVLHRRRAHGAGHQGQVLQAGIALGQRPGHHVVPALAGAGFHDPVALGLFQQAHARDFHLEHRAHTSPSARHCCRRPAQNCAVRGRRDWRQIRTSATLRTRTSVSALATMPKVLQCCRGVFFSTNIPAIVAPPHAAHGAAGGWPREPHSRKE